MESRTNPAPDRASRLFVQERVGKELEAGRAPGAAKWGRLDARAQEAVLLERIAISGSGTSAASRVAKGIELLHKTSSNFTNVLFYASLEGGIRIVNASDSTLELAVAPHEISQCTIPDKEKNLFCMVVADPSAGTGPGAECRHLIVGVRFLNAAAAAAAKKTVRALMSGARVVQRGLDKALKRIKDEETREDAVPSPTKDTSASEVPQPDPPAPPPVSLAALQASVQALTTALFQLCVDVMAGATTTNEIERLARIACGHARAVAVALPARSADRLRSQRQALLDAVDGPASEFAVHMRLVAEAASTLLKDTRALVDQHSAAIDAPRVWPGLDVITRGAEPEGPAITPAMLPDIAYTRNLSHEAISRISSLKSLSLPAPGDATQEGHALQLQRQGSTTLVASGRAAQLVEHMVMEAKARVLTREPTVSDASRAGLRLRVARAGKHMFRALGTDSRRNPAFTDSFLLTYRIYMGPDDLIHMLFEVGRRGAVLYAAVLDVVMHWVTYYWADFSNDAALCARLLDAVNQPPGIDISELSGLIEILRDEIREAASLPRETPPALPPQTQSGPTSDALLQVDAQRLAEQMTLFDYDLLSRIHPIEFIHYFFPDAHPLVEDKWPNLQIAIKRFDEESYWVTAEICSCDKVKHQAALIAKFIHVAELCLRLGNMYSLFSIIGALTFPQVTQLKRAWKLVPEKTKRVQDNLVRLMEPSHNMKAYRDHYTGLLTNHRSHIPFLALHLKDLLFVNETSSNCVGDGEVPDKVVDFSRLNLLARCIADITLTDSYRTLVVDAALQAYLRISTVDPASIGAAYLRRSSDHTRRSSRASLASSVYVSSADTRAATRQDLGIAQRQGTQTAIAGAAVDAHPADAASKSGSRAEITEPHAGDDQSSAAHPVTATGEEQAVSASTGASSDHKPQHGGTDCAASRASHANAVAVGASERVHKQMQDEEESSQPDSPTAARAGPHAEAFGAAEAGGDVMLTPDRQQQTRRRVLMDLLSPAGSGLIRRGVTPRGTSRRGSALRRCQSLEKLAPQIELEDCAADEQVHVAERKESPEGIDILVDFPTVIPRESVGPAGKSSKATSRTSSQATIALRQRPLSLAALPLAAGEAPTASSKHSLSLGFANVTSLLEQAAGPDATVNPAAGLLASTSSLATKSSAAEVNLPGQPGAELINALCEKVQAAPSTLVPIPARPAPLSSASSLGSCHGGSESGGATLVVIEDSNPAPTTAAQSLSSFSVAAEATAAAAVTHTGPGEQDAQRASPVGSLGGVPMRASLSSGGGGGDAADARKRPRSTMFGMLRKVFARRSISIEHLDAQPGQQQSGQDESDQLRLRSTTMDSAVRPKRPGKRVELAPGSSERGRLNTSPSSARASVDSSRSSSRNDAQSTSGPASGSSTAAGSTLMGGARAISGEDKHAQSQQLSSTSPQSTTTALSVAANAQPHGHGHAEASLALPAAHASVARSGPDGSLTRPSMAAPKQASSEDILQIIDIGDDEDEDTDNGDGGGRGPASPVRTSCEEQQPLTARRAPPSYPSQNQLQSLRVTRPSEQEVSCFSLTGLDESEIIL